jgi:PKD repeat protein
LTVTFSDPDAADTHTVVVDWGDGTESTTVEGAVSPLVLTHTYATVGHHSATVTVTDDHGNADSATAMTTVVYGTTGVRAPLKADGSSVFKYRSTIPVKVGFVDCGGLRPSTLAPTITVTLGATTVLSATMTSFVDGEYLYELATKPLPDRSATYLVTITVPETGQIVTATFTLRP